MFAKKTTNFSKHKRKVDTLYRTDGRIQMQAIPENSNTQTKVCLTGTLCTMTAFIDPPKSRKTVFAFAPVTNLQKEGLHIPGDCDSGSKSLSRYLAPFLAREKHWII